MSTTMAVRLEHLGMMLPTPFEGILEQLVGWRTPRLGLQDSRVAVWVVNIAISGGHPGVLVRRARASVRTIAIER